MIILNADKKSLTTRLFDAMLKKYDRTTGERLLYRVNGEYDLSDKEEVVARCDKYRVPIIRIDVFKSGVDEENRLEIEIGYK